MYQIIDIRKQNGDPTYPIRIKAYFDDGYFQEHYTLRCHYHKAKQVVHFHSDIILNEKEIYLITEYRFDGLRSFIKRYLERAY